ncbi:MAG: hypothetical protein Q9186_004430 [Xanthomendoza sp. 1 TL-2023]
MAEKPPPQAEAAVADVLPASRPNPVGNPVFRMMGMPNFRFKLPSRNWLIFLSVTGSFTTAILYDRYHKKRAQQRWCNLVSHIAKEPFPSTQLPRRITIFLSAPPGDSLRAAREHFHEYVKPVLVAGALDWDVIEGRREGDVRAGLAEKIRKRRKSSGERRTGSAEGEASEESEDLIQELRSTTGVKEWEGLQGDLVLGRHTWKEYIRGLHEGWLGPLDPPPDPLQTAPAKASPASIEQRPPVGDASLSSDSLPILDDAAPISDSGATPTEEPKPVDKKDEKSKQPVQKPPYIPTSAYPSVSIPSSTPEVLPPTAVLPLPNLLGFLNTPIRIYRFLNRRYLADETGREVAALVLASHIRGWDEPTPFASEAHLRESVQGGNGGRMIKEVPDDKAVFTEKIWQPESVLEGEERDWHKSAWKRYQGEPERVWKNLVVVDPRLRERMRRFDLTRDDENKAKNDSGIDPEAKSLWERIKEVTGWVEDTSVKGWEHGLVGQESE